MRERRDLALVVLAAALLYLPWLGATGLWDPWETHYAEVARQMLARHDWVYPWWEGAYFFSKPVLSFWMMALGMKLAGIDPLAAGELPARTEWAVRLPFAFSAIVGVAFVYLAISRIVSRRAGLLAAFALGTSPLWLLLARQAVTDMPFASMLTAAMCCLAIAELADDPRSRAHRDLWLWGFYAFCGLATLAKGLLGFMLPGAIALLFMGLTADPALPRRVRIPSGSLVFLAMALPWYLTLSLFGGKDEEGLTFVQRFFVHDHLARLAQGVHTTTPGGTFTYFVEQLGYGIFPWVILVPGALLLILRMRPRGGEKGDCLLALGLVGIAHADERGTRRVVGVEAEGMTACPCAQLMVREHSLHELMEAGFSEADAQRALDALPVATHNQRGRGAVMLGVDDDHADVLRAEDLVEIVESSMSSETYDLLKRPDEFFVVNKAHHNPKFVEDVVRGILARSLDMYADLPNDTFLFASQVNYESIHKHDAFAEAFGNFGEFRQELESGTYVTTKTDLATWLGTRPSPVLAP